MITKVWDERFTESLTDSDVISKIVGHGMLTRRFGGWPTFEGAELLSLQLDRGNHWWVQKTGNWSKRIAPYLIATFYVFDNRFGEDSPDRNPSRVGLRFEEFEELEIDGFNHHNPIVGMGVSLKYSSISKKKMFRVDWGGPAMKHEASFLCAGVEVLSVEAVAGT
jgi:hypothetical protein